MRTFCSRAKLGWLRRGSMRSCSQRADLGVLDVEVFDADVPAVGLLEAGDEIDQPHLAAVEVVADVEERLEIGLG